MERVIGYDRILEYDRANLWVAKVLEVRAKDNQHVYLRVFWLYWPDELPNGRQPYHGANEFIMSNAMDIVDAMTDQQRFPIGISRKNMEIVDCGIMKSALSMRY